MKTIYVTTHKTTKRSKSKLDGLVSISTSPRKNPMCSARSKMFDDSSICKHCYAMRFTKMYKGLAERLDNNFDILADRVWSSEELKEMLEFSITTMYARIEAFGDVSNVIQARNYIRIIKLFPNTTWGVWTKNYSIWKEALDIEGKPDNMIFITSSFFIGRVRKLDRKYVDNVFTVMPKDTDESVINCGGRQCATCLKCHTKNDIKYIYERLK